MTAYKKAFITCLCYILFFVMKLNELFGVLLFSENENRKNACPFVMISLHKRISFAFG